MNNSNYKEKDFMRKLFLSLAVLLASVVLGAGQTGTLTASCSTCSIGELITLTGTGFQNHPSTNQLNIIIWDDSIDPVICSAPTKQGDFTCTVSITTTAGWYNIVAYNNSTSVVGATGVLAQ